MPLVPTRELLDHALAAGNALPAFNIVQLETAEALVAAAEETGLPLVLQISQNNVDFHGGLAPIAHAAAELARSSSASLSLHLDHCDRVELIDQALELGFGSVMYDGSHLPDDQNREVTRQVVERAARTGVVVEAELGEVGGKDGVHAPGVRTKPDEAAQFVADTGVDLLAVAVGSSHAMVDKGAELDIELVSQLALAVPVPLVLHGSSGVPDRSLAAAIAAGIVKVNVSTQLNVAYTRAIRAALASNPAMVDPRKYMGPARTALKDEAVTMMRLIAGR